MSPWQRRLSFVSNNDFILEGLQDGFKPDITGTAGYDALNYTNATSYREISDIDSSCKNCTVINYLFAINDLHRHFG